MTTFEIVKKTIESKGYMHPKNIKLNTNLFKHMNNFEILDVVLSLEGLLNTPIQDKYLESAETVGDLIRAYQQQSRDNLEQKLNLTYQQLRALIPVREKQAKYITR